MSLVCVGSAGSGSQEARDFLEAHLRPLTRDGTVRVVNDVRLVLAADLDDGIAVVAGTGSNCVGCSTAARSAPAAGAACLATRAARTGREAVRDVLQAFHDEPGPPGWARHAAAVLGCGDPHADPLLRDTADPVTPSWPRRPVRGCASCGPQRAAQVLHEPPVAGPVRLASAR